MIYAAYDKAIKIARDLIEPDALDRSAEATEYARGICEFLADAFPHNEYTVDRARQIAREIGITDRDIYDYDIVRASAGRERNEANRHQRLR